MAKRKLSGALAWIMREAKKLRREYPRRFTQWKEYVAQASAIYAKKHKGKSPVGHKRKISAMPKHSRRVRRKIKVRRKKSIIRKIKRYHRAEGRAIRSLGTLSGHLVKAKQIIVERIAADEALKFRATKKSIKRKIAKRISNLKARYRKLS